jgi:geranylgeranyl pyrophosphate synthase
MQKTTALMRLSLVAGGIAAGAGEMDLEALGRYGNLVGEAYQVCDDIVDEMGANADAWRHAERLVEEGIAVLRAQFGARAETDLLAEAAHLVIARAAALVRTDDSNDSCDFAAARGGVECGGLAGGPPPQV